MTSVESLPTSVLEHCMIKADPDTGINQTKATTYPSLPAANPCSDPSLSCLQLQRFSYRQLCMVTQPIHPNQTCRRALLRLPTPLFDPAWPRLDGVPQARQLAPQHLGSFADFFSRPWRTCRWACRDMLIGGPSPCEGPTLGLQKVLDCSALFTHHKSFGSGHPF